MARAQKAAIPTIAAMLALASCFAESGSDASATTSGGNSGCPSGALGCDCYGNQTCDEGLDCRDAACVPEDCVAGTLHCVCDGGECEDPATCFAGLCVIPEDQDPEDPGASNSSFSSSTPDPSDTGTTGMCDGSGDCNACIQCARTGPCMGALQTCLDDEACAAMVTCYAGSCELASESCALECRDDEAPAEAIDSYQAAIDCLFCRACTTACAGTSNHCG